MEVIDSIRLPLIDDLCKASTDNFIVALEEIGTLATNESRELMGTHEHFRSLFKKAVLEAQQGVSLGMDMVLVIGRKLG